MSKSDLPASAASGKSREPSGEVFEVPAGRVVEGQPNPPGSKSITQRFFNLALLGRLPLVVRRPLLSEDTRLFLEALRATGFEVTMEGDDLRLEPGDLPNGGDIFCGNGGTLFRFLTAALTAVPGVWRLDGVERLRERTVAPLVDSLRNLGARIECPEREGFAPLVIRGGTLEGGETTLDASASSQFLSALLMAGLAASRPTTVRVEALTSAPYVDLTLDAIADFGGEVHRHATDLFHVQPSQLSQGDVACESDFSSVAYPAAAAALAGGSILIPGLRSKSRQGDRGFIDVLQVMGANVCWGEEGLEVSAGSLRSVELDLSRMPDQVPTLAALAPFAEGTTRITNVPHLRIKESDRLAAMARELSRVGAEVEELADGLVIPGIWHQSKPPKRAVTVETYGDHRIAMSMALVGLRRPGIRIRDPHVVAKSYPAFWSDFESWIAT